MNRFGEDARALGLGRRGELSALVPAPSGRLDPLTGLESEALLLDRLAGALVARGAGGRIGVMRCEIDGLASVNRAFGGSVGDLLLRTVADRLGERLVAPDLAARIGGATFAVLLCGLPAGQDPRPLVTRFARRLTDPVPVGSAQLVPDVRLGLAISDPLADRPADAGGLLALAADTLARARRGANVVSLVESDVEAEVARVAALRSYDVHDPALDGALHAMSLAAAAACETLSAFVTFVDSDLHWVRAAAGTEGPANPDVCTPRHLALCDHTIRGRDVLEIVDTSRDPRYRSSRHASWQLDVRYYAGAPLVTPDGRAIGALSVADTVPRRLTPRRRRSLAVLAGETMSLLEAHRAVE